VCPERIDLIHKNYRKLCNLLIDVDEWGQVVIINMLTRYARTQFVDPNRDLNSDKAADVKEKPDDEDDEEDGSEKEEDFDKKFGQFNRSGTVLLDPDHRLLLRVTKPLLQSRNSAVRKTILLNRLILILIFKIFNRLKGCDGRGAALLLQCAGQ
jgi:AP-3 complex subunit beta